MVRIRVSRLVFLLLLLLLVLVFCLYEGKIRLCGEEGWIY